MTIIITHLIALVAGAVWGAWRTTATDLQDHTHASRGHPRLRLASHNGITLIRTRTQ
jgi:hypothetical protein